MSRYDDYNYTIDPVAIGARIKAACILQGITSKDLQQALKLASVQAVYRWYTGDNVPTVDNLACLSRYLHVSLDYLIFGR